MRRRTGRLSQRYEMTGETGSTRYMCPEVAMQLPYNEKVISERERERERERAV